MRTKRFTKSQKLSLLEEVSSGGKVSEVCRKHQISVATYYKWKKALADEKDTDKRRLKELEKENARLKRMYSELSLDHDILKSGYEYLKKWQAQVNGKG